MFLTLIPIRNLNMPRHFYMAIPIGIITDDRRYIFAKLIPDKKPSPPKWNNCRQLPAF